MNRIIAAIWGGMLLATVAGVVPTVVALLRRAVAAARNIERYTGEILTSGVGIATNTANVAALKDTLSAAPRLLQEAQSITGHAATIEARLGGTAAGREENT